MRLPWRMEQPQVFYTYEWSLAVQRAYRATLHPLIFLAMTIIIVAGVVALATDDHGCLFSLRNDRRLLRFSECCRAQIGYSFPRCSPNCRNEASPELTLTNLPADSPTVVALQQDSTQSGYRCFARTAYICAQVSLDKLERRGRMTTGRSSREEDGSPVPGCDGAGSAGHAESCAFVGGHPADSASVCAGPHRALSGHRPRQ